MMCDVPLTVKRILLDCPKLRDVRQKYFNASYLKDVFDSVDDINKFQQSKHYWFLLKKLIFIINCSLCY